ncbi:MAG TPA: sigma-70 family RNA polymerase sigma factor [Proteiniclasticum sp.]|nr:sigma-70 family RNA polymerase sigma factor [Proteiniclasticum sp.]
MKALIPEELWDIYNTKLKNYIMGKVSDKFEAEDLFQEVGIRVLKSEKNILEVDNVEAWLYRIASNAIIDYYRRKDRLNYVEDVEAVDAVLPKDSSVSETDNYNYETASCLLKLAEILPEKDKEAILQSDFKGVPQNSLSEAWGLSHSGAKNRVQRARKKLKETMLDCCEVRSDHQGNILELVNKNEDQEKFSCIKC